MRDPDETTYLLEFVCWGGTGAGRLRLWHGIGGLDSVVLICVVVQSSCNRVRDDTGVDGGCAG